ncbi:hypothetical protein [Arthrobacter sp. CG_A4]|uniref:hypothetical protein n=1 Tax=Arthrobacter sp. CG_A4 TaxID=3071706 RepID=UPI002DFAB3FF|nr:hypothetical protein [Arthrobacter sp. CG_A4]
MMAYYVEIPILRGRERHHARQSAGVVVGVLAPVSVAPADYKALEAYSRSASASTTAATQDPAVKSAAYPVQRMKGVEVHTPTRIVTPSPLRITLVPVGRAAPTG